MCQAYKVVKASTQMNNMSVLSLFCTFVVILSGEEKKRKMGNFLGKKKRKIGTKKKEIFIQAYQQLLVPDGQAVDSTLLCVLYNCNLQAVYE